MSEQNMPRRRFLSVIVAAVGAFWATAAAGLAAVVALAPLRKKTKDNEILLGDVSVYGEEYKSIRLRIPVKDGWYERTRERIVYIRANDEGLPEVLSGTCTHLGCTVQWNAEADEFQCPCHGGKFSPDGEVIAGPPPRRLAKIPSEVRGGDIYVRLT